RAGPALRWCRRGTGAFAGFARPADADCNRAGRALCALWRDRDAAADPRRHCLRGRRASDRGGAAHDDAAGQEARPGRHADADRRVRRHRRAAAAATSGAARRRPAQLVHHLVPAHASDHMNATGQFWTLVWTFALMSFFAVGGANSAIPEMHRLAVDVHHWMNDKEFADMFAISQLSPGPNVLIVTLIGY